MPLSIMNFGGNFGGDEGDEAGDNSAFIVQTIDKTVIKLTLEENFFTEDVLFTAGHLY